MRRFINIVESILLTEEPSHPLLDKMKGRGAFNVKSTPRSATTFRNAGYEVAFHPAEHPNAVPYVARTGRDHVHYYDPAKADLIVHDQGEEYLERTQAEPKAHVTHDIQDLGSGYMYRGMSFEGYQDAIKTGQVRSKGMGNIGTEQVDLTYWTTDVETAQSYANSFANLYDKATFTHPAFIVAARVPDAELIRHVNGVGSHEIGLTVALPLEQVVAVWRGEVYWYNPGSQTINSDDEGNCSLGSSTAPSSALDWVRIK